ncbi:pyridoxamine 5'-phosphate oxidase family protein [Parablautia muri]|uniref:Pyridoxamine 5'-phosphate oxidase family protein n=1 Tax=Parablautia muri TaxID=2320879 RepID=A0A9X5BG21_9FIRM|nr:pyridoxamine 5'-phosphate oxidase family protein [Parablautia muri]NBJ92957.1 pyridoxamine 5'-phosphate oxidase family protein [Parablautia muri]
MRRQDREIKDFDEILQVISKCQVCRLALNDGEYPYILPLNFGMALENGKVIFYFHGALEGKKYDLIAANNKAGFEMDCAARLVTTLEDGNCTMEYESVIGRGKIEILPDSEKERALDILMKHYHKEDFPYNKAVIPRTKVFKLTVETCTGKRRMKSGV